MKTHRLLLSLLAACMLVATSNSFALIRIVEQEGGLLLQNPDGTVSTVFLGNVFPEGRSYTFATTENGSVRIETDDFTIVMQPNSTIVIGPKSVEVLGGEVSIVGKTTFKLITDQTETTVNGSVRVLEGEVDGSSTTVVVVTEGSAEVGDNNGENSLQLSNGQIAVIGQGGTPQLSGPGIPPINLPQQGELPAPEFTGDPIVSSTEQLTNEPSPSNN